MLRFFKLGTQGVKTWENRFDPGTTHIALLLWLETGDQTLKDTGLTLFSHIMQEGEHNEAGSRWSRQYGDFDSYPILHAAWLLKQEGLLPAKWETLLRSECLALQKKGLNWRHGNRELGKLAGPIFAAFRFFPEDPAFDSLRTQAKAWWQDLNRIGCLDESSGNYSSLGLSILLNIAHAMRVESDLRNARWHQTFTMYRDLVTPSGHMPEWGDDYFEEGGKFTWCYLFEYAANLYQEPSFALAARKLFARQLKQFEVTTRVKLGVLRQSMAMLNVKPMALTQPLGFVSGVNYRPDPAGVSFPFTLLLRPDLEPGSPMVMMDLYGLSDHAHMEKRGSVTYYEHNHIPLFHGRNRHHGRHAGDGGNSFYLQPEADSFPFQPWDSNTWYTVRIPYDRFAYAGKPGKQASRLFARYYGNFKQKKGAALYLDNLRLEGPAGLQMIDAYDKSRLDEYATAEYAELDGRSVLAIPAQASSFGMPHYNVTFAPKDYRILAYDIKWTGPNVPDFGFRYSEDSLNMYNAWHHPGPLRPFYADLSNVQVEQKGKDSCGEVSFTGYGSWDTQHKRRLVLAQEGVLVIRDHFTVGASADGWTGGEVWQFEEKNAQGDNWFAGVLQSGPSCVAQDKNSYQCGMLTLFEKKDNDVFQSRQVPWGGKNRKRWLAYTKFMLQAGQQDARTLVVVPYGADQSPADVAASTHIESNATSSQIIQHINNRIVTIKIDDDGQWRVTRKKQQGVPKI